MLRNIYTFLYVSYVFFVLRADFRRNNHKVWYHHSQCGKESEANNRKSKCQGFMEDIKLRAMNIADYDRVRSLWESIRGFGIRSIDDSREEIARFLQRNPSTSVVALDGEVIVGAILCGNDGRQGSFYHVCVAKSHRRQGIGTKMVVYCMNALKAMQINKIALIAFTSNDAGNAFWRQIGWTCRSDCNYYEFALNEANITRFIESEMDDA